MWQCQYCGATFAEPFNKTVTENLDGENGWWTHTERFCPKCGSDEIEQSFEEVVDHEND